MMQGSNTMRNIILSLTGMAILFAHSAYGVSANLRLEQATVSRKYDPVVYKLSLSFRYSVVSSQKQIKKPILRFMAIYTKPDGTREVIMRYSRDCRNTLKARNTKAFQMNPFRNPKWIRKHTKDGRRPKSMIGLGKRLTCSFIGSNSGTTATWLIA